MSQNLLCEIFFPKRINPLWSVNDWVESLNWNDSNWTPLVYKINWIDNSALFFYEPI